MDLARPVTYRGLTLNDVAGEAGNSILTGIRLTRVSFSEVTVHGYTEKRSLEDGMDASDVFLGGRRVSLTGEVFAKDKAALFDKLDLLRLKFTPTDAYNESPQERGFLPLAFEVQTEFQSDWPGGYVARELRCRPSTQPQYDIELGSIFVDNADGYAVPFQAGLEAIDPRFYHPTLVEDFISGTSGSGTLRNRGNYPAPLNILLHVLGSVTGEGTFTLTGLGTNMVVTIPASTNDRTVRVDSSKKVVTVTENEVETLRMDLIEFLAGTTWPKVLPTPEGDNPVAYDWTCDVSLDALSRLFFSEAWA